MKTLFLDVSVHSMTMTFVEGVPPSKHFRCITQRDVLRPPITQPNIPEEQVAYSQLLEGVATRGYDVQFDSRTARIRARSICFFCGDKEF